MFNFYRYLISLLFSFYSCTVIDTITECKLMNHFTIKIKA